MILQISPQSTAVKCLQTTLSDRECEVLRLVAHEYNTLQVADLLCISEYTVISHRQNIMMKLNVKNAAGMVRRGFEIGVLTLAIGDNKSDKSTLQTFY